MKEHILISGTGRAGTSALVHFLTELQYDTGFAGHIEQAWLPTCQAGLEHDLRKLDESSPLIVKDPAFCEYGHELLTSGGVNLSLALICVRDITQAAGSRIHHHHRHRRIYPDLAASAIPGGLVGTDDPDEQQRVLLEYEHSLICTLSRFSIPMTFLHFPSFVLDWEYCYDAMESLRQMKGAVFGKDDFKQIHHQVFKPQKVHAYSF